MGFAGVEGWLRRSPEHLILCREHALRRSAGRPERANDVKLSRGGMKGMMRGMKGMLGGGFPGGFGGR